MLWQQTSPKRWFANVNTTSYCDVTNNVYPVTMTTIRHCLILKFGRGACNRPAHHQTSACHWRWAYHCSYNCELFSCCHMCFIFIRSIKWASQRTWLLKFGSQNC